MPKDSKTNLPPTTLSVVIPAMPAAAAKGDSTERVIEVGCVFILGLAALTWFTAENFDLRWVAMAVFVIALAALAFWATFRHRRTMAKHRDFEGRLHETALKLSEKNQNLKQLVQVDPLTQLLNRRGLERALAIEMSRCRRKRSQLFAVLLDCDDFKSVNENFGHAVGDLVLESMAQNILRSIRPTDFAARVGGDEFVILLVEMSADAAAAVAERIRANIAANPVIHGTGPVPCTASLGVSELPSEVCSIEEVLVLTRLALKASKKAGKNKITASGLSAQASARVLGDEDAETASQLIGTGQGLKTVWQPIVRLSDRKVVAYEALARGPAGAFEQPSALFNLARQNGILTAVDMKCLKAALFHAACVPDGIDYHINIFPSTLVDMPLELLEEALDAAGATSLCVDITEQHFMGAPDCLADHIELLKNRGVRLALDDVGFGHSTSLESFIFCEPDFLKIHGSLIDGVSEDLAKQRYVLRLMALAGSIDATIIAEGVEREEDLQMIMQMGVSLAQGFCLAPPAEPLTIGDCTSNNERRTNELPLQGA